ncbi:MAG: esterase [Methylophilaceae bacterium]
MKLYRSAVTPAILVLMVMLTACTQHIPYRTNNEFCINSGQSNSQNCDAHSIQQLPAGEGANYLLGFIEFDDQGQLWDRKQMKAVVDKFATEAANKDLLMVVFVHGWQHNAAPEDGNIKTFRNVLTKLSMDEKHFSEASGQPARQVAGVYLGWRGESISVPLVKNLTFWDRKNTAEKVGHGGVTEVLNRLEQLKSAKDSTQSGSSATRLIVIGHSFGGAIVHNALTQILESRFIHTTGPAGLASDAKGFGNLVVLINPAFEAGQYTPLSDMSTERGFYFESQLPVVAILTSEADYATRYAFPAGRWLSTLFESTHLSTRNNAVTHQEETISQDDANVAAVGHFKPYRTHKLYPEQVLLRSSVDVPSSDKSVRSALAAASVWAANDAPGSKISIADLTLERTNTSAGRNPYLVIQVDRNLIANHNDIDDPRIIDFIQQLIFISNLPEESKKSLIKKVDIPSPSN